MNASAAIRFTEVACPAETERPRVAALDGIRGVAILLVVIHNAGWIAGSSTHLGMKLFSSLTAAGWVGVQVFFVLSGFLITGILLNARGHEGYFRRFFIRRTLRIFPLYYLSLACALIVVPAVVSAPEWEAIVRERQWLYWTYLSNWDSAIPGLTHFWSLAVEEQFYVVWPLVVLITPPRHLASVCAAIILGAVAFRVYLYVGGHPPGTAYTFTLARMDALAWGALLAAQKDLSAQSLKRVMEPAFGLAVVALIGLVIKQHGLHDNEWPVLLLGQSVVAILGACLVYVGAISHAGPARELIHKGLCLRWLRWLGRYSYAIYIVHFPLHFVLSTRMEAFVRGADDFWRPVRVTLWIAGVLMLSAAAAVVLWHVLERPIAALKERWAPAAAP